MIFRALTLSAFIVGVNAAPCPEVSDEGFCNPCGGTKCVTEPDNIFAVPGQPALPCGQLEALAFEQGVIPVEFCAIVSTLFGPQCGCADSLPDPPTAAPVPPPTAAPVPPPTDAPVPPPTDAPTDAPVPPPTDAPVPPPIDDSDDCPTLSPNACRVCGPGKEVVNDDNIFTFPDQPQTSCGILQIAGASGLIPVDDCVDELFTVVDESCGCKLCGSTPAPVAPPTASPVAPPTASPTDQPTADPTRRPTLAPTDEPTRDPTASPTTAAPVAPTPAPLIIFTPAPLPPTATTYAPVLIVDPNEDGGKQDGKKGGMNKGKMSKDKTDKNKDKATRRRRLVTQPATGVRGN